MNKIVENQRRGMALLVVVVLTMLIALGAYRFSFYMESQYRLTRLHEEQVHAKLAALSGLELAASIADLSATERTNRGGLFDNPAAFRHVAIMASTEVASRNEQANTSWRFGLVSLASNNIDVTKGESNNIRFGFENESGKLHMPTLLEWDRGMPGHARAALLALPGATEQLVDAWLQGLGVKKQRGGANGTFSLLDRLESSRENSDLSSETDQLKSLWFGGDLNQNYRLDPLEIRMSEQLFNLRGNGPRSASPNSAAGSSTLASAQPPAWQKYVTWHSGQRNETRNGQPRINLNEANLQSLHQKLISVWPAEWANFVIAMRQYGSIGGNAARPSNTASPSNTGSPSTNVPGNTTPAQSSQASLVESPSPDFTKPASFVFKSPLDLVGAVVQISVVNPQPRTDGKSNVPTKQTLRNPFSSDLSEVRNYLGRMLDATTTDASPFTIGRIDVSEAPAEVLAGVPGIDMALAQRIVQQRSTNTGASTAEPRDTIAWLLEGGVLDISKLRTIEPYITSRNDVYSVQSVGYRDNLSPVYRCTATIDARQIPSQIRNYQIWHPWDRGFTMDQLSSPTP